VRIRSRLDRLTSLFGTGPRIAAVVEDASGRVLQVLRGPLGFEPAPADMVADDLPPGCQIHPWLPQTTYLGWVDPRTGQAVVQMVHGIDLDVVLGNKSGWLPGDQAAHR
jgi:hypothetical protein